MCSGSWSGACASCPSLAVREHPCSSDTCQCVFSDTPWHNHWEYSAPPPPFLNLFGFVLRLSKYVTLSLHPLVRARNLCPCGRWFESCFLLSWTFRHRAICNQAGSQEAHTGAHMAGLRSPAQPPPTRSHDRAPHAKRGTIITFAGVFPSLIRGADKKLWPLPPPFLPPSP